MPAEVAVVDTRSSKRRGLKVSKSWLDCWRRGAAAPTAHHPSLTPELVAGWPSPSGTSGRPFDPDDYSPAYTTTPSAETGVNHGLQKHMYSLLARSSIACCPPDRPTRSTPTDFRIFRLETILQTSPDPPVCPTESCARSRLATSARK